MQYPHLKAKLDEYCVWLQAGFKQYVQYRTGALCNSIKVSCEVEGKEYVVYIDLNNYWKWIPNAFPMKDVLFFGDRGKMDFKYRRIFGPDVVPYSRYIFLGDLPKWELELADALAEDVIEEIHRSMGKVLSD